MKIIKKGALPEERVAQFKCNYCNAVLEATAGEGVFISDQRDGSCYKFSCPECGKLIYVNESCFKHEQKQ